MERAEAAVIEGIQRLDPGDASGESLFWSAIESAIASAAAQEGDTAEPAIAPPSLPRELKRVLRLATSIRQCYVLRVLAGLPREVCAHLLNLDSRQIDNFTCDALQQLSA
jgi:hypothetical protein